MSVFSNMFSLLFSDDGTIDSISGTAIAKDPSEPAKLDVSFFESKNHWFLAHFLLQLLDCPLSLHPQTLPLPLTGYCPPTTTTTVWSTAAATSGSCTQSLPGSWAGSPPWPKRPLRSCTAPCPPLESTSTNFSPPTRIPLTAAPWTSKQISLFFSCLCTLNVFLMQYQCNKHI